MAIKDRLELLLQKEGLTALKLAEMMEVQPSSISHLLSGRNNPNFDFVSRILKRFPRLNPDWILNGYGSMYRDESVSNSLPENELFTDVNHDLEAPTIPKEGKHISKILVFYSDKTFIEYRPSDE